MIPDSEEIGKRLKELRGTRTLQEVADACGVSKQAYWMYEAGTRTPADEIKKKIADYYQRSVNEIFFDLRVNQ